MLITITDKGNKERSFDHSQVTGVDDAPAGGTSITLSDKTVYETATDKATVKQTLIDAGCCSNGATCTDFVPGGEVSLIGDGGSTNDIRVDITPTTYPSGMSLSDMTSIVVTINNSDDTVTHATQTFNNPITNPLELNDTNVQNVIDGSGGEAINVIVEFSFDASGLNCSQTMTCTFTAQQVNDWITAFETFVANLA